MTLRPVLRTPLIPPVLACLSIALASCNDSALPTVSATTDGRAPRTIEHEGYTTVLVKPPAPRHVRDRGEETAPRILCVTAHPDDELAFCGVLFKAATHLGAHCELAIVTNGEGGYKYTTLAERLYGLELTDPEVGRRELPRIRRRETLAAAKILGIQRLHFFGQTDHRFTLDPAEVLAEDAGVWELDVVRRGLREILDRGQFDFLLTHLPRPTTHGHHKAATILALEAVAAMPPERRPVPIGSFSPQGELKRKTAPVLNGYPITEFDPDAGPWSFDLKQKFGFGDKLDYRIIANQAIAAHRSQGSFQMFAGQPESNTFRVYALDVPNKKERLDALFAALATPQFPTPTYDPSGKRLSVLPPGVRPTSDPESDEAADKPDDERGG